MSISLRLAVDRVSWGCPGSRETNNHIQGSNIYVVAKGVKWGEVTLQVYQGNNILETIEVSRLIDLGMRRNLLHESGVPIIARSLRAKLALKLKPSPGEEKSILFQFLEEGDRCSLQKVLEERGCPFDDKPATSRTCASTSSQQVEYSWSQPLPRIESTFDVSTTDHIRGGRLDGHSSSSSATLKERARRTSSAMMLTTSTSEASLVAQPSELTSFQRRSSAMLLPPLPKPTVSSKKRTREEEDELVRGSQERHRLPAVDFRTCSLIDLTDAPPTILRHDGNNEHDHPGLYQQAQQMPQDTSVPAQQPTSNDSDSSSRLSAYALRSPSERQSMWERFVLEKLNDPTFVTLCEDAERCWQRFALER